MEMYHAIAHSKNSVGKRQSLGEHLSNVADAAGRFAVGFGLTANARYAGLLHDAGKLNQRFQEYLAACEAAETSPMWKPEFHPRSVPHALYGALAAGKVSPVSAMVILGHHTGLYSRAEAISKLNPGSNDRITTELLNLIDSEIEVDQVLRDALNGEISHVSGAEDCCDLELLIRLLFSALIDADWLDTEAHFNPERSGEREQPWPSLIVMLEALENHLDGLRAGLTTPVSPVNVVRDEVGRFCREAADREQGVFKLTVPTGGGKTLAALSFAINHAVKHGLDRVIVAIPYTSIIDQTARVYRNIFAGVNPCPVIEHHSNVDFTDASGDDERPDYRRLATENWDAPLVVTTTVQLFDSLFSNRPAKCRKLHNIAKSVVVIDEVQTLPAGMLEPLVSVMGTLVKHARTSIVLSTATQPALDQQSRWLKGFDPGVVREIIPLEECQRHFSTLRRVEYDIRPRDELWPWSRVAEEMLAHDHSLVVVNLKRHALSVVDELAALILGVDCGEVAGLDPAEVNAALQDRGVLHLSGNMCGAHRLRVIEEVQRRLKDPGAPIRLVSTQVVEAGVDLDFPVVMRAMGPLDAIIQAAGRCNREGRLGAGGGRVVVFRPEEGLKTKDEYYLKATEVADEVVGDYRVIDDPEVLHAYFGKLIRTIGCKFKELQDARKHRDFPKVSRLGQLISSDTEGILITNYHGIDENGRRLIDRVVEESFELHNKRDLLRMIQPYMVNVFRPESTDVSLYIDRDSLPGITRWSGRYDDLKGIVCEVDPDIYIA